MGQALDLGAGRDTRARRAAALAHALERLRRRLRIAVVFGGDADAPSAVVRRTHNPRPWKSYERVARDIAVALESLGFAAVEVIPEDGRLGRRLHSFGADIVWLNTGGVQGEAPMAHAPSLLESLGVPYVGLGPLNAALLDAKHIFKSQLLGMGLPTAPFGIWDGPAAGARGFDALAGVLPQHPGPFVVKPVTGRASLNVEIAETRADLSRVAADVAEKCGTLVQIEPFLGGAEYCVSVMGPIMCRNGAIDIAEKPIAFSAVERRLAPGERLAVSMDRQPITSASFRMLAEPADAAARIELEKLAVEIYRRLRLESVVRIDARRDLAGRLMVLEANPKPDLKRPDATIASFTTAGLDALGMTYEDLVMSILANRVAEYLFRIPQAAPHLVDMAR